MYLILKLFATQNLYTYSYVFLGEEGQNILLKYPELKTISKDNIKEVLIYKVGNMSSDNNIYFLKLDKMDIVENTIKINCVKGVAENKLSYTKNELNRAIYGHLLQEGKIKKDEFPSRLILLNEMEYDDVLMRVSRRKIKKTDTTVEELKRTNNWEEILKYYKVNNSIDKLTGLDIWNNPYKLSDIAFAASKLGEIGRIELDVLKDYDKKQKALDKAKKYREFSQQIYERCKEIDEYSKLTYIKSIGYINYNNLISANNLSRYKVETDEGKVKNFKTAYECFKKVLNVYPNDIKVLYRNGYMAIEFGEKAYDYAKKVKNIMSEGANYLKRAIESWEQLKYEEEKKRTYKEYIKSHYSLGCYYQRKVDFGINKIEAFSRRRQLFIKNPIMLENSLIYSKNYFEKCLEIQMGALADDIIKNYKEIDIKNKYSNWAIEAVDLFYRLGITYFYIYLYLANAKRWPLKEREYLEKSKRCFGLALHLNWIETNKKMPRDYIEERLARVYIATREFDNAIKLLEKYREKYKGNKAKEYILRTLYLAESLNGELGGEIDAFAQ